MSARVPSTSRLLGAVLLLALPGAGSGVAAVAAGSGPALPPARASSPGPAVPGLRQDADEALAEIEAHLASHPAGETLEMLRPALERHPDDGRLFALASRVADEAAETDTALWYTHIALELLGDDRAHKDTVEALEEQQQRLDTVAATVSDKLAQYDKFSRSLFDLGRAAARKKLYVNAVDLFTACLGTSYELRAARELDELFSDPKAQTALLQARVDVPRPARSPEEVQRIAELDAQHDDWDEAYVRETDNFTIRTNMGYEMAEEIAGAMEQMSEFFRKIFNLRSEVPHCDIHVLKSRAEFDEHYPGKPPTVRGFFMPGQKLVVTYDPRTDGWGLSNLWSTLFHEATHLFMDSVCKARVPGWMSEGTACYFEGAKLMPNGTVLTNDIPLTRLMGAAQVLQSKSPSIEEVLSFLANGSPPGSHYPPGWALVYFFNNCEDDRGDKPYLGLYEKFLKAYQKREPKEEPLELFEKVVIGGTKDFESMEQFKSVFNNWMVQLHNRRLGGPEKTAEWLELAEKQIKNKKYDSAMDSYRFAAAGDPKNLRLLMETAELHKKLRNTDAAAYNLRKLLRLIQDRDDSAPAPGFEAKDIAWLREEALKALGKANKSLGDVTEESLTELPQAAMEAAQAYVDGDLPRMALRILDDAGAMLGGLEELRTMRDDIAKTSGVETRRWRLLDVSADMLLWNTNGDWAEIDGMAEVSQRGTAFASWRRELPASYRFEITFSALDREGSPFVGMHFGNSSDLGEVLFGVLDTTPVGDLEKSAGGTGVVYETVGLFQLEEGELGKVRGATFTDKAKLSADQPITLAVDVGTERVEFFLNGNPLASIERPAGFEPKAGLFVEALDWPRENKQAEVRFDSLRLFH